MRILAALFSLSLALPSWSQFSYPSSASTRVYLGHLVDGGPAEQKWTTTMIVSAAGTVAAAPVKVWFYDDAGAPLALDFGQGAATTLEFTVPAGGTTVLTTRGTSATTVQGWAIVESVDTPPSARAGHVTASLLYRAQLGTTNWWDVATAGTGSTFFYSSYGTRDLGVAVANPSATATINLKVTARHQDGTAAGGPWTVQLPPRGHKAWTLYSPPTSLNDFTGTIQISPADATPQGFVALSLNYRDPVMSPLPPGQTDYPAPHDRQPWDIGLKTRQAALQMIGDGVAFNYIPQAPATIAAHMAGIGLVVEEEATLSASFQAADGDVHVSRGLIEALGHNDAALAFLLAHMLAHGVMHYDGIPTTGIFANNPELIGDTAGLAILLWAGFDPNGGADFFARLQYANLQGLTLATALKNEFNVTSATGVQSRLQAAWNVLKSSCGDFAPLYNVCQQARKYWHPTNPATIP